MSTTLQRCVSVSLTICVLFLSGVVYAQTVEHAVHHAHHQTATHATVLCSWMCAAGQAADQVTVGFPAHFTLFTLAGLLVSQQPPSPTFPTSPNRGPPFCSV